MLLTDFRRFGNVFDMWRDMDRLHREMNTLFSGSTFSRGYPAINIWLGNDDAVVTSELAGIDVKQIDLSVEGDVVTIGGLRPPDEINEGETYHRQERAYGNFRRNVRVPFRVDPSKVEARYEKGVLSIKLPRLESDKPKKISIKTE